MERTGYAEILKSLLSESPYFVSQKSVSERETVRIFDDTNGHYLLVTLGWQGQTRIYNVVVHARLHQGKIWIEEDWTEDGITEELMRAGIPKEEIVLGFQPPNLRPYIDFATA